MRTIVHSARVLDAHGMNDDSWVRWDGDRITHLGEGDGWREHDADEILDASAAVGAGSMVSAGFVDIHGHGGAGMSYDDGPEAIRAARRLHRAHGTTSALVSLVSAPLAELCERVAAVADLVSTDADILGSHLEGPFLAPSRKGAHDAFALTAPRAEAVDALLAAGRGTVRQVTIAPELPGGIEAIRTIVAAGAAAAIGHTDADATVTRRAIDAGASLVTHAFNAMPGLGHRDPGPLGAAIADPRVTIELIADGVHVHPDVVRVLLAAAPGRVALITDAMAAAGAHDGPYRLGSLDVEVRSGIARLKDTDTIAGSTLTQDAAVRAAVAAGASVEDALRAATSVPAAAIGRDAEVGRLQPGSRADVVLLDHNLHIRALWASGCRAV